MFRPMRMRGSLWLIAIGFTVGCGKSDGRGGSSGLQPVAAQEQPKGDSKEPVKGTPVGAGTFAFSGDAGGKILERILPPTAPAPLGPMPAKPPSERILPAFLAAPDPSTVPATLSPRSYPQPARSAPRPTPLPDRIPFELASRQLDRPETIVLPVGGLTKIDPIDVSTPAVLPILARPTPDRAPLEDPTTEFTTRSIVNDNLPLRATLAVFTKLNLPEPFENAEAAKVKGLMVEDPSSVLGNPPLPRP